MSDSCKKVFTVPLFVMSVMSVMGCGDPDDIDGPCLHDGTSFADEVGDEVEVEPEVEPEEPIPIDNLRPDLPDMPGWERADGLDGLYRMATADEVARFDWVDGALVVATPFEPLQTHGGRAWLAVPSWSSSEHAWRRDDRGALVFVRRELMAIQELAIGHFVEHRQVGDTSQTSVARPVFGVYGMDTEEQRGELLRGEGGQFLARFEDKYGSISASAPHRGERLDIPAPPGFALTAFLPDALGISRDPLEPYSCENGACEDPDDPLDECNDGLDNDGDGVADLCDWNCLPHADFGADAFPDARSRVENGKAYAMMGGGSICTVLGDTWTVEFADMALKASTLLADVRPEVDDPVRFRVFSCWVFENEDAFELCQYGPYEIVGDEANYMPPLCPVGMEDYPYQPTEGDQLLDGDQANLHFEEAIARSWQDLELNTLALGVWGEPMHGVAFLTEDVLQTCSENLDTCAPSAGLAPLSPNAPIKDVGSCVVTNRNPHDWHTLGHEVGHTLGLAHDWAAEGFMNDTNLGGVLPLLGLWQDNPNTDNNVRWALAFETKGSLPRSSGWSHTGCSGDAECAPLGKPGWSCNGLWCVEDP